jgi:hypothetical protein
LLRCLTCIQGGRNTIKENMQTLETIVNKFPITEVEYKILEEKFGSLCYYAAWQLKKKNSQNYFSNDPLGEDDVQELRIALLRAGSYYKRQTYIESCFKQLEKNVKDSFNKKILKNLQKLWDDRRRHGANRQKFGEHQEHLLDRLVFKYIPKKDRPNKYNHVIIDSKFATYAKQIIWNATKQIGKKITREKSITTGLVSLSEFDYLSSN